MLVAVTMASLGLAAAVIPRSSTVTEPWLIALNGLLALIWTGSVAAATAALLGRRPSPIVLSALALIAILVAVELGYQARFRYDRSAEPTIHPAPYVMSHARPGARIERPYDILSHGTSAGLITVNSEGHRGPEWPTGPRGPQELRVAVIGGSAVFSGLTDDRTIPALLAATVADRAAPRRVVPINGGIVSANSTQELVLLTTKLVDVAPDIVVVLDGFNDIWMPLFYESRLGYPYAFTAFESSWGLDADRSLVDRLVGASAFAERVLVRLGLSPGRANGLIGRGTATEIGALPSRAVERWESNWRKMAAVCDTFRIRCLFALQPTALYARGAGPEVRLSVAPEARRAIETFYALAEERIEQMRSSRAFEGAMVITLAHAFEGWAQEAYWDPVHVFDEGHELLAHRLADAICGAPAFGIACR